MEKSVDAFRTISEVAEDLALPQHVLRFWETRFPQIKPMKRAGGRRYYRPADVDLLKIIRQLLYEEGFTIKGVQKLIKEQGTRAMREGHLPMPVDLAQIDGGSTIPDDAGLAADLAADEPTTREEPRVALDAPLPDSIRVALVATGPTNEGMPLSRRELRELREALGTIDECTRILDALRKPR